jgi:3-methyladenine DNA glycosylase AlkC
MVIYIPSISSKSKIIERTQVFWESIQFPSEFDFSHIFLQLSQFLKEEYNVIPSKERIGKGRVFIAKCAGEGSFPVLKANNVDLFDFSLNALAYSDTNEDIHLKNFALVILAKTTTISEKMHSKVLEKVRTDLATHTDWEIREMSGYSIREGLKAYPEKTLSILNIWIKDESNSNLRRAVTESLRPLADIKWLRNPQKNDEVIKILDTVISDSSVYVRKSVGNNFKDLTKYMPQKILNHFQQIINGAQINIVPDLASKSKKELGKKHFYLIWTLKHSLRWLRARNPEFHGEIKKILGQNYLLYYDEKTNILAKPK